TIHGTNPWDWLGTGPVSVETNPTIHGASPWDWTAGLLPEEETALALTCASTPPPCKMTQVDPHPPSRPPLGFLHAPWPLWLVLDLRRIAGHRRLLHRIALLGGRRRSQFFPARPNNGSASPSHRRGLPGRWIDDLHGQPAEWHSFSRRSLP